MFVGIIVGLLPVFLAGILYVMDPAAMMPLFVTWYGWAVMAGIFQPHRQRAGNEQFGDDDIASGRRSIAIEGGNDRFAFGGDEGAGIGIKLTLCHARDEAEDDGAGARINLELLKRGIIVRPVGNYGLPQWLRISIGLPEENAAFIDALKDILAQQ